MAELFEMSASDLNKAVYVAVAAGRNDPQLDILAGATYYMLQRHPKLSTDSISDAITNVHALIEAMSPAPESDRSPDERTYMIRILSRLVPAVNEEILRDGVKDYTQAFLNSYRRGVHQERLVAPIESEFDQFGEVDSFRRDIWERLHQLAVDYPTIAAAIDRSSIAETLGAQIAETARTLLGNHPIEPLNTFVIDHLLPDDSLSANLADLETQIIRVGDTARELSDAYRSNLSELNGKEQELRDAMGLANGEVNDHAATELKLKEAIEKAQETQKDLDETFEAVRFGVDSTLDVVAFIASQNGEKEFAADIKKFAAVSVATLDGLSKVSKDAINTAEKLSGLLKLGSTGFMVASTIGFAVGLVGIAINIVGILGDGAEQTNKQILDQLKKITELIERTRREMHVRFDRIDKKLNRIMEFMREQLDFIKWDVGEIAGNVEDIQTALYDSQSAIQKVNRDIHAFLEDDARFDFKWKVNQFLDYREHTAGELSFEKFWEALSFSILGPTIARAVIYWRDPEFGNLRIPRVGSSGCPGNSSSSRWQPM
jgi:hypothetical protein